MSWYGIRTGSRKRDNNVDVVDREEASLALERSLEPEKHTHTFIKNPNLPVIETCIDQESNITPSWPGLTSCHQPSAWGWWCRPPWSRAPRRSLARSRRARCRRAVRAWWGWRRGCAGARAPLSWTQNWTESREPEYILLSTENTWDWACNKPVSCDCGPVTWPGVPAGDPAGLIRVPPVGPQAESPPDWLQHNRSGLRYRAVTSIRRIQGAGAAGLDLYQSGPDDGCSIVTAVWHS